MKTCKIKSLKTDKKLHSYGSDFLNNYWSKFDEIYTVDEDNTGSELN